MNEGILNNVRDKTLQIIQSKFVAAPADFVILTTQKYASAEGKRAYKNVVWKERRIRIMSMIGEIFFLSSLITYYYIIQT